MDLFSVLLQPLILISGVALLIMSTIARLGQLEAELSRMGGDAQEVNPDIRPHLLSRVRRFRRALSTLYVSASLLACASLLGAVLHLHTDRAADVVLLVTCVAIAALLVALFLLISDSRFAAELVERRIMAAAGRKGD